MHPHRDNEILIYLRSGQVKHLDSEGHTGTISSHNMMVMNAGASFFHEENVLAEGGVLTGLQIFIRPETAGLPPRVQFYQLPEVYNKNRWRKIAGKGEDDPLQIKSNTWLMDLRLEKGKEIILPAAPADNCAFLFYVFEGKVNLNDTILTTGESVLIENESPVFRAVESSDIVLFITQTDAVHFDGGMYSGNLHG